MDPTDDAPTEDATVRLTASAVAARLGVSTSTLRTWHRRHGLGPSDHASGRHRRYSLDDVARLRRVRALTASGVSVQSAADVTGPPRGRPEEVTCWSPGQRPGPALEDLLRAAAELDGQAVRRAVAVRIRTAGVVDAWENLCVPALTALGSLDGSGSAVAAEHVASWAIAAALNGPDAPVSGGRRPDLLLACAPGERHVLPLDALRAASGERGFAARTLGQDVPGSALVEAVSRLRPTAVVVWAQTASTARAAVLPRPGTAVVLPLGPGWDGGTLPVGSVTAPRLSDAVVALQQILAAAALDRRTTGPDRRPTAPRPTAE